MKTLRWYAAYTQPRHERRVVEHLRLRDAEVFLPLYSAPRRWSNGQKVNLELPLFPGYVFVRTTLERRVQVLGAPGLVSLVGYGSRPVPVPDDDMDVLTHGIAQLKPEPHPYLKIGDRARVRTGPLAGREGILLQKKDKCRFVLSMDLIMQSVSVEIDAADLEHLAVKALA